MSLFPQGLYEPIRAGMPILRKFLEYFYRDNQVRSINGGTRGT